MASALNDPHDSWDDDELPTSSASITKQMLDKYSNSQPGPSTAIGYTTTDGSDEDDLKEEIAPKFHETEKTSKSVTKATSENSSNGPETSPPFTRRHIPEPEVEGMEVKPSCSCTSCTHWIQSNDWTTTNDLEFEGYHKKTSLEQKRTQPLLRCEKYPGRTPKISKFSNTDLASQVQRQAVFKTLVHGQIIPKPVTHFTETYFTEEIQRSLARLNYKYSLPLQSFAWPAIFRQMNVIMIGDRKSGKTMAYLPAIATFTTKQEEKYEELARHKGPLVIIICSTSQQCEEVHDLLKKLLEDVRTRPKISIVTYPATHIMADILITIPDSLIHCLQTRILNFKRLCHLVLEDAGNLLSRFEGIMYTILNLVDEMLEHRVRGTSEVQLIVTSTRWSTHLEKLYKSLYVTPLICIENYLEAALYADIHFDVKMWEVQKKKAKLKGILQSKSKFYKTIVFCNNSEGSELKQYLHQNGIGTIYLSDSSSKEEIEESIFEWSCTKASEYNVLLCTDFIFDTSLCINDAVWLIHYSFPATWTKFTKRFSALSSYYEGPWNRQKGSVACQCFLMLDETCDPQMLKVINLTERLLGDLPASLKQAQKTHRARNEKAKLANGVELCHTLKLFGKCFAPFCESRHVVEEGHDVSNGLPKKGKVSFKILNMKDVTQYTVQLVQHVDTDGSVRNINDDDLKKPLVYSSPKRHANNIKIGNFYAHCDNTTEGAVFTLCHVLSINNANVEVKLMTGLSLQTLKTKLYEVPSDLRIVDVFLCNLIPPFRDENFSGRSFFVTRTSLEKLEHRKITFTGDILLQLDQTLWLDNVVQGMRVDGIDVIKFNLTKHIINLQVVEKSPQQITGLHKVCSECDVTVPTYVTRVAQKPAKAPEVEPQRAFLDDNINEVYFTSAVSPDEFYVRLVKFFPLLANLEKEIQIAIKTEIPNKKTDVEIGKYYLGLDQKNETYARVKILNVEDDRALCFYVDYGDEGVVDISTLRILPTKYISKLPFQAIQCRLYGLCPPWETWDDEATDILYNYLFEPNSDIFRSLFVDVRSKDAGDAIRAKTKYSVLLKDVYGEKNVLINQLLFECGLATSIFKKFDDFEVPQPAVELSGSDSDEPQVEVEKVEDEENLTDDGFDEEQFEFINEEDFLKWLDLPKRPLPQIEAPEPTERPSVSIVEVPSEERPEENAGHFTPELYWSQTDRTVKIKVKLVDVENYRVNVARRRIFMFNTDLDNKNYQLKFTLHKPVELSKHYATGQEVVIVLSKSDGAEWLQLTGTNKRMRYIHYEVPDLKEEKPKKFLQLDISDEESDGDDDGAMFHTISDLDSEFDEEFHDDDGQLSSTD